MMRNIRIEVQKILHLPYLLLGVVGIIALCLTATGDMNAGGSQISIFSLMIRPEVTNTPHTAFELWRAGIGGWLLVFAPMLLTVGYMISLSGERQNGQIRFALMRSGKLRYCISKVCGGALAGGIIFLIGYAVFGLLMVIRFPALSTLPVEEQEMYLMGSSLVAEVVKRLIGAFLYGITGSLFGIGVAIVFRDKYMLICLPFIKEHRELILITSALLAMLTFVIYPMPSVRAMSCGVSGILMYKHRPIKEKTPEAVALPTAHKNRKGSCS